jgi:hypothetical protein
MNYLYIASDNTAKEVDQAGESLGVENQDVIIHKIIWGVPSDTHYITIYDKVNPVLDATTNIAAKITQPTAAAGKDWIREIDFGPKGLHLGEGGSVVTNGNQITVIWEAA